MKAVKILILVIGLFGLLGVGFGVRYIGACGNTIIERKVFEESYQRSDALKARIATDEAVLAEIEARLAVPGTLDETTQANLMAQARAARIRIQTAKSQQ